MKRKVEVGQVFDYLTVVESAGTRAFPSCKKKLWRCQCKCGNETLAVSGDLLNKKARSCGCRKAEEARRQTKVTPKQRYGRLTVVEDTHQRKDKRPVWRCLCDCGNEAYVTSKNLLNGATKSCGCIVSEMSEAKSFVDITGKRFGRLTVTGHAGKRKTKAGSPYNVWECQCDCGNKTLVKTADLNDGNTKSCGCMKASYTEWVIHQRLNEMGLPHDREYSFPNLLSNRGNPLRFDYAFLSGKNVVALLEYQGPQHYKDMKFGEYQRKVSDKKKRDYCLSHNIPLLEIRYDQNLEAELKKITEQIKLLYANSVPSRK